MIFEMAKSVVAHSVKIELHVL